MLAWSVTRVDDGDLSHTSGALCKALLQTEEEERSRNTLFAKHSCKQAKKSVQDTHCPQSPSPANTKRAFRTHIVSKALLLQTRGEH